MAVALIAALAWFALAGRDAPEETTAAPAGSPASTPSNPPSASSSQEEPSPEAVGSASASDTPSAEPTSAAPPALVRTHHPSQAKLSNGSIWLGPVEARLLPDAEVDREAPSRTRQVTPDVHIDYYWDPAGLPTAADECRRIQQPVAEQISPHGEVRVAEPVAIGDGAVDTVVCSAAGKLSDGVDTTVEWMVAMVESGTYYTVQARYATANAGLPSVAPPLTTGAAQWPAVWAPTSTAHGRVMTAPPRIRSAAWQEYPARDMTLTAQDVFAGPVGFKLPENFTVVEQSVSDSGTSMLSLRNDAADFRILFTHSIPSEVSPTLDFCERMMDASVKGAEVVDRLPAFELVGPPEGFEELKDLPGAEALAGFDEPARVVTCAAHVMLERNPGVEYDLAWKIWESKDGERIAMRSTLPLDAWRADSRAFSMRYLDCIVSQYFGSDYACTA